MLPSRSPLLIVPIRDRRQRRRILTIRNCAISMLSIAVVVASISVYNNSHREPATAYGRLFGTQVTTPKDGVERKVDVIDEGTVADQVATDPMLVAPAVRERLLMADSNVPAPPTKAAPAPALPRVSGDGRATAIVGDGTGVAIVHPPATSTEPRKLLAGGIFKQQ
jgi:hypothetical protein